MRAAALLALALTPCFGCPGGDSPPDGIELRISPEGPLTIEVGQSQTLDIVLITTLPDANISVDVPEASSVGPLVPSQASCDFPDTGGFSPRKEAELECEFVGPTTVTVFASRIDNTNAVSRAVEVNCVAEGTGPGTGGDGGTGPGGAGGEGGVGGSAGGSGAGGSAGSGGSTEPIACGSGFCGPNDYCDDPLNGCETTVEANAVCAGRLPPATDCVAFGGNAPVCGCDGEVYDNLLCAEQQGTDISFAGGCTPPDGTFACGSTFCDPSVSFCSMREAPGAVCEVLPGVCGGVASCDCIATPCPPGFTNESCVENGDEVTVTCLPE